MIDLYVYTYGLDNVERAVINVLLHRKYDRIDCTGQFQRILTEDSSCVVLDPDKLTEEEWEQMDRRFSGELSTLILLTKQPDRQPEFPHYIIWPDRPYSAKREMAMDILRKAQFPCLLPIDRETGKSHVLNDGFVVIDIETSGIDSRIYEITKLSAVWVADFRVVDRFETLVQIERPIHCDAEKLTGITNEMLKDAPCIEEALQRLVQWHPLDPAVFYCSKFDTDFLHTALVKTGVAFNACRPQIDLMYLTARLYTTYSMEHTLKLSSTAKLLPEPQKNDDALLIAELLIFYLQKLQNEYGFHCVSDLFKLYPYEDVL